MVMTEQATPRSARARSPFVQSERVVRSEAANGALTIDLSLDLVTGTHRLGLHGELDQAATSDLALVLCTILGDRTNGTVIDLAALDFIDLAGARLLATASMVFGERGCEVALLGARPTVARVLRLIGVPPVADLPGAEARADTVLLAEAAG